MASRKSKSSHPEENNSDLIEMAEMEFQPWSDTTPEAMWSQANRTHMVWLRMALAAMFQTKQQLVDGFGKEMNDEMIDEMFNGFKDAKGFLKVATETIESAEARIMCALSNLALDDASADKGGAAMKEGTTPNRRAMLAGCVGAALATSVASAAEVDLVYAVIELHKRSRQAFEVTCRLTDEVAAHLEGRVISPADEATHEAASDAEQVALTAVAMTRPTSAAGLVAVLSYILPYGDEYVGGSTAIEAFVQTVAAPGPAFI